MHNIPPTILQWPLGRRLLFRFFFIVFLLLATPWSWLDDVPGIGRLTGLYDHFNNWLVNIANSTFLHVRPVLVPQNGSGDTSFGWASLWTYCCCALLGAVIWSLLDRKRRNYTQLNY